MTFDASHIVTTAQREAMFHERYPNGRITFEFKGVMPGNEQMIWGIARIFRDPDDRIPVTGTASETAVGLTNYTKGSELANLETSAVGRALRFLGCIPASGAETMAEIVAESEKREAAKRPAKKPVASKPMPPEAAKPEWDPWAADAGFTPVEPEPEEEWTPEQLSEFADPPKCPHGVMEWRSGTSKSGKPWKAFMCQSSDQSDKCPPAWR